MPNIGFPLNITRPTSGQVQWDGPVSDALQTLIDAVEAKVTADGIDIQSSLDANGNYFLNILGLKFSTGATGTARSLYWNDVAGRSELFVTDGAGTQIQLTSGGSLNISLAGGIAGLPFGTAAVTFSAGGGSYTFVSSTGVYATLVSSDHQVHNGSDAAYVDIKASAVLGGTYSLTLPSAAPSTTSPVVMDSTGTLMPATGVSVAQLTASQGIKFSNSYSLPLSAPKFVPVLSSTHFPQSANYPNLGSFVTLAKAWDWRTNPALDRVAAPVDLFSGDTVSDVVVRFDRVETTGSTDAHTCTLQLVRNGPSDVGAQVIATVSSAATGSTLQTMRLAMTASITIDPVQAYTVQFIPGATGSALYGVTISGTRNFGL